VTRDAQGGPLRMVGAANDVTERVELLAAERSARRAAEAARHRLELLARAGTVLSGSLDPQDTLRAIAHTLVPDIADQCVVLNGVAKTYAMTGWRVGWMIGPVDVVNAATNLQSPATSNVNRMKAAAAVSYSCSAFGTRDCKVELVS